ncbi:TPA: IS1182 family transposase [Streptococcus suis]|nr:IS1182 family transposase [Streptococcus suis]HEM4251992.1 IS1182 family transposase [Streptococcus suis]
MLDNQIQLDLSSYSPLYDIVVPKNHFLRQLTELCDFSFIYDELEKHYCVDFGRKAYSPIMMFKYLLLKDIYHLSDVDVVDRSLSDMAFKYFLGLAPEDSVIDASSLTKFRKLRIKDEHFLDLLIQKSVQIALEHKLIKQKILIVDATHTKSHYRHKKPQEVLRERSKALRKTIYQYAERIKDEFPTKPQEDNLEKELEYSQQLISVIEKHQELTDLPAISQKLNYLKEAVEDDIEHMEASVKEEARIGYKSADTSFYGYKEHIAMTDERIITACVVTSGEKSDGKYLKDLYEKTLRNGVPVETIIGDAAYSGKENIKLARKENVHLVSKLNPSVSKGCRKEGDCFEYNKDAGLFVCPQGHMAVRKARTGKKNQNSNQVITHYFDVEKCKICPSKEGCYKEGAQTKTYSVTIKSHEHLFQKRFQETPYFKEMARNRYKIEAKNAELKQRHGLDVARASGLFNMELQAATTIFVVNMKRIMALIDQKEE